MDLGDARGVAVSALEIGQWAWSAWTTRQRRTGVEATEMAAQQAGGRALDQLVSQAAAAAFSRRELPRLLAEAAEVLAENRDDLVVVGAAALEVALAGDSRFAVTAAEAIVRRAARHAHGLLTSES